MLCGVLLLDISIYLINSSLTMNYSYRIIATNRYIVVVIEKKETERCCRNQPVLCDVLLLDISI